MFYSFLCTAQFPTRKITLKDGERISATGNGPIQHKVSLLISSIPHLVRIDTSFKSANVGNMPLAPPLEAHSDAPATQS